MRGKTNHPKDNRKNGEISMMSPEGAKTHSRNMHNAPHVPGRSDPKTRTLRRLHPNTPKRTYMGNEYADGEWDGWGAKGNERKKGQ